MIAKLMLGLALAGAEWVLYVLILLSILSIALIFERALYYKAAEKGLEDFREAIRKALSNGKKDDAANLARARSASQPNTPDLETELVGAVLGSASSSHEVLDELSTDAILRARVRWDRNLAWLATIGSNAPFIGLFGTVLGIIQAFHDLSRQATGNMSMVTAGISEALIATAIGIMVAIPATIAYNVFARKVKTAGQQAEALKSFVIGTVKK